MSQASRAKIQLCGRFSVELGGRWVEDALPGGNGRLLFAYLVLNRPNRIDRDQLLTAVYGEEATPDHRPRLSVLLSKLRHVVGSELLVGRSEVELVLPPESFVDVEAAFEALRVYDRLRVLLREEARDRPEAGRPKRVPSPARRDDYDDGLISSACARMSLRETLPTRSGWVSAQVRPRLLPKLVVVLGLDHLAARAVDPLHVGIVSSARSRRRRAHETSRVAG